MKTPRRFVGPFFVYRPRCWARPVHPVALYVFVFVAIVATQGNISVTSSTFRGGALLSTTFQGPFCVACAFSSRQRWASAWFKASIFNLARPELFFQQPLRFSRISGSWNPEVNSFGFKSRLFCLCRLPFRLGSDGLRPGSRLLFYLWASASPFSSRSLILGLDRGPGTLKLTILGPRLSFSGPFSIWRPPGWNFSYFRLILGRELEFGPFCLILG